MRKVALYLTHKSYVSHAMPVYMALPLEMQGGIYGRAFGIWKQPPTEYAIVGGYEDGRRVRRPILVEHGVGQTYDSSDPTRAGGRGWDHAALFLSSSSTVAGKWKAAYPQIPSEAIGDPSLDRFHGMSEWKRTSTPVVALSFRWDDSTAPEATSALPYWKDYLPKLAEDFQLIGHGHPRAMKELSRMYQRMGIAVVERFNEVAVLADVLCCDNSSVGWEFQSIGKPTVWLGSPQYQTGRVLPPRFPPLSGQEVNDPEKLPDAIRRAARNLTEDRLARERTTRQLYGTLDGKAAVRGARAIQDVLEVGG